MRTEVIEIWHGKRRWRHQIHGVVDTNSGEERGYYEYGKMKAAPEMREYENGSKQRRGIMDI